MQFPDSFFEDEVRNGFYVPALMKCSWAAQMEILADVARVCEKYHIKWFAHGGTLLGAVRHNGFIPWDDDLDICMFREDYIRFNTIAEKELPKGYYIPRNRGDNYRLLLTVCNGPNICLDEEHLNKFHNFPFCSGIDIFALDYVARDPEEKEFHRNLASIIWHAANTVNEKNKNTRESLISVEKIQELLNISFDKEQPIKEQLFVLLEHVFSFYTPEEAKEITFMPYMLKNPAYRFPIECYQDPILLPFESMNIPAPRMYQQVLKAEYGDYEKLIRTGGDHAYPFFQHLEKHLTDQKMSSRFLKYRFSPGELNKKRANGIRPQKLVENFLQLSRKIHNNIYQNLCANQIQSVLTLLDACQNSAFQVGSMIEQVQGKASETVTFFEQYCELLYQIYKMLQEDQAKATADSIRNKLDTMLLSIENSVRKSMNNQREIVFLPYKASMWSGLEPIWKKAMQNPNYHVSVIPIPYYYKDSYGHLTSMKYEGNCFPDYVPITHYDQYDFKNRQPDMILIHNPYDEYNLTTSVHPFFYARNLKQYTDNLIYVPCFPLDEIQPDDLKSRYNMRYYVSMPGIVHADLVLVQSEQMQQNYIDHLTDFAGKDTRHIWLKKIRLTTPFLLRLT